MKKRSWEEKFNPKPWIYKTEKPSDKELYAGLEDGTKLEEPKKRKPINLTHLETYLGEKDNTTNEMAK